MPDESASVRRYPRIASSRENTRHPNQPIPHRIKIRPQSARARPEVRQPSATLAITKTSLVIPSPPRPGRESFSAAGGEGGRRPDEVRRTYFINSAEGE